MDVVYGDMKYLNRKKVVYIKGDLGDYSINSALKYKNINIDLIEAKTLDEAIKMFKSGEVDIISLPRGNNSLINYNNIFKYSSGITYIVGNENSKHIIKKFDEYLNMLLRSEEHTSELQSLS